MLHERDILFFGGGAALLKYGRLNRTTRIPRLGGEEFKETFTRSAVGTSRNRQFFLQTAEVDLPRTSWEDLDGDGILEAPGLLIENVRTNGITQSDNPAAPWATFGTGTLTQSQADPYGSTKAVLATATGAGDFGPVKGTTGAVDGTNAESVWIKYNGKSPVRFGWWDNTAATHRVLINVTFTAAGVLSVASINSGSGAITRVVAYSGGWYRICFNANNVVGANTNQIRMYAASTGNVGPGSTFYFGPSAESGGYYPTSYIPTLATTVTRNADNLKYPINWTPPSGGELTVYFRYDGWWPRSGTIDLSGTNDRGVFSIGGTGAFTADNKVCVDMIGRRADGGTINMRIALGAAIQQNSIAIPSSGLIEGIGQVRYVSGQQYQPYVELIDGSNNLGAAIDLSGNAGYRLQELHLGTRGNGDTKLDGWIYALIVARGRYPIADFQAVLP